MDNSTASANFDFSSEKLVSISFSFNVGNSYFYDQIKKRLNALDLYINNIDFSDFAFSDFLDLLSEIYDSYEGDFRITLTE